jgi:hypothetical protein
MLEKLKSIIKWGRVSREDASDTDINQILQVETVGGKPKPVYIALPYGVSANIPDDTTIIMLSSGGSGQDQAGIPTRPEDRFKGLKVWEIKIGNYKTKANVFFNDDGQIEIVPKSGKETVISGGTEPAIKGTTFAVKYDTHVHPTAFGPSGVPSNLTDETCFNDKALV